MSNYTDKILAKIQREQKLKEAKEAQLEEPISMASSDDADIDFDFDNSVSDGEFSESFFNDDAQGDEVKIDLDEPDEEIEEVDTLDELRNKEINDKKKKKGRVGELEEQELEEHEPTLEHPTENIYAYSEEISSEDTFEDIMQADTMPAEMSDEIVHNSIIDAVVQSEIYEKQIVQEQEEQERIIASAYTEEPSLEVEMEFPNQQNLSNEAMDVVSSVVSSDAAERFYSADEMSEEPEPSVNRAVDMSDATVEIDIQNVMHAANEETVINHVVNMSDAAEEQYVMSAVPAAEEVTHQAAEADMLITEGIDTQNVMHTANEEAVINHVVDMSDTTEEQYVMGTVPAAEEVIQHTAEAASLTEEQHLLNVDHVIEGKQYTAEEYADVKSEAVIDNLISAPDVPVTLEESRVAVAAAMENVEVVGTASVASSSPNIIDNIVADKAAQVDDFTTEPINKNYSAQEAYEMAAGVAFSEATVQENYIAQSGSNAGFDTRARVADMVPDEQIKSVTERYVSEPSAYAQEFSPEVKAVLTGSSNDGEAVNLGKGVDNNPKAYTEASVSTQENQVHNVSSDKEVKTRSVANDNVEQRETEIKQSEFKEQTLHQFVEIANGVNRQLQMAGNTAIHSVTQEIATSDKNTKAGFDDIKKFTQPIAEAATIVGMSALASSYSDKMMLLGKAGAHADKLIAEGKLSTEDLLLSKRELNKQLKSVGVSGDERKTILQNRTDIHDMMGVRSEMRSMAATGQIKVDDKLSAVLQGSDFFDMRNKQMGQLLQLYYKNSSDDTIRNVFGKGDFTGKSSANFRKFLQNADKNELSANGRASIKMGKLAASRARSNRELSGRISAKLKGSSRNMISNLTSADQNTASGTRTLTTAGNIASRSAKIGAKVLIGTRGHGYKGLAVQSVRVVKKVMIGTKKHGYKGVATQIGRGVIRFAKYTDKSFYALTNHSIGHFVSVSQNNIRRGKNALRESIHRNGEIVKKKAIVAAQQAKKKAANTAVGQQVVRVNTARINATNAAVAKYKAAQQAARKAAQKIAQTKAAKAAYATGNAVAKGANLFIGTPLRFGAGAFRKVKLAIGKIFSVFNAIKKYLIAGVGIFCAIYIVLVLAVMGILSIFSADTTAVMNILLPDRDEFVTESIERYLEKSEDILDAAVDVGEGIPLTQEVTSGHTIDKYGHPDADGSWVQGYKIFYTDSQGNIIQSGSNNVKDTLILAYVQMDAEWKEEDEDNATDMMDKYFKWLNPNSDPDVMLENCEETDIYFCDGCTDVYYTCNGYATVTDTSRTYYTYDAIMAQIDNGTKFFGDIIYNYNGDYYRTYCRRHYDSETESWINHGTGYNRAPSGCSNYSKYRYCTGHHVKACYGHRDIKIYIPIKTMQDAFDEEYMVSEHSFLTFLNGGEWTEDDQDWCWSLYNADWYDLYGTDPSGGVGFTAGGSLTQEEVDNILSNCGDASQLRQNLLSTALSQVGSLPYYYGGKPTSGSIPIQTNRGQAGSSTNIPDHVGRTIAGLDCFGFCQWVYWNTTGSNIMPEGSAYTTTSVYNSTTSGNLTRLSGAGDLKIGDLGFQAGHVGMFAGVSEDGKLMWIHCSGGANTVVYGTYNGFNRYYRLNGLE